MRRRPYRGFFSFSTHGEAHTCPDGTVAVRTGECAQIRKVIGTCSADTDLILLQPGDGDGGLGRHGVANPSVPIDEAGCKRTR